MAEPLTPEREAEIRERVAELTVCSLAVDGAHVWDRRPVARCELCTVLKVRALRLVNEVALLAELDRVRESLAQEQANHAAYRRGAELAKRHLTERINSPNAVPRTERSYWAAIADALNAAEHAGMPIGIDLDGTVTDHNAWSVVWDHAAEEWAVAGYDAEATS